MDNADDLAAEALAAAEGYRAAGPPGRQKLREVEAWIVAHPPRR
jgi:hypothetical protein